MNFKKHRVLKAMAALALLFVGWFVYQLFFVSHSIKISKETTHWTEPLNARGTPDFHKIVLDAQRQGATAENNAAIPFWQAMWPGELRSQPQVQRLVVDELGMAMPDRDGLQSIYDVDVAAWLFRQRGLIDPAKEQQAAPTTPGDSVAVDSTGEAIDPNFDHNSEEVKLARDDATKIVDLAREQPWTAERIPPLADWARDNAEFLDLLVAAGDRPQYYNPSPSLLDGKDEMFIATLLPAVNMMRESARSLLARAMLRVGSGEHEAAWTDIRAVYRLGDHLDVPYATLVEGLVRFTIVGMANEATAHLLSRPDLPRPVAEAILAELSSRPPVDMIADSIDNAERLMGLDVIIREAQGEDALGMAGAGGGPPLNKLAGAFDWNLILSDMNTWYDRLAEASRLESRSERQAAFDQIDSDVRPPQASVGLIVGALVSSHRRSEVLSDVFSSLLTPAVSKANAAEDRINTQVDLVRLAAALAVYRAGHGEYPADLAALVPEVLPALPVDLFHRARYAYRRTDNGYYIYSLGRNGVDDEGSNKKSNVNYLTYHGYNISSGDAAVLFAALGEPPPDELDPELPPEVANSQKIDSLRSKIPEGADDIAIRMPPLPARWPTAAPPAGGGQ